MAGAHGVTSSLPDPFGLDFLRAAEPDERELSFERAVTAPTEWVPHASAEPGPLSRLPARRGTSAAALWCGIPGLLVAVFWFWGAPLSLAAVILGLIGLSREPRARTLAACGLLSGLAGLAIDVGWYSQIAGQLSAPLH